jgi:hypothetical protein
LKAERQNAPLFLFKTSEMNRGCQPLSADSPSIMAVYSCMAMIRDMAYPSFTRNSTS